MEDIVNFAYQWMQSDPSGHDFYHAKRVAATAVNLFQKDYPNDEHGIKLVKIMAYLHDTIDEKLTDNSIRRLAEIKNLDTIKKLSLKDQSNIFNTIQKMSYSKNLHEKQILSIEGQYVQDADRLDALGAIGIARAFAYGGVHHQLIYDETKPQKQFKSATQYHNHQGTTINHFYEKLLKLENLMNSPSAKKLAHERTDFMRKFLIEFDKEK
ncbi:HD domain-containing protein [Ligilactobacillus sp. LYQ135]